MGRPGGRLRVILPDCSAGSPVVPLYAARLGIGEDDLREIVAAAAEDFRSMSGQATVELYQAKVAFPHAMYLFDAAGVLALYATCCERIATPAFIVHDGELLSFLRADFDRLIDPASRRCERIH